MKLRELMKIRAIQISSSAMLAEAVERMEALGTDVLAVVEDRQIIGIVSQRDLTTKVLPGNMLPAVTPIRCVMTFGATCCSIEDDIGTVLEIVKNTHAPRVIVLDCRGMAVGVLSAEDLNSEFKEHCTPNL